MTQNKAFGIHILDTDDCKGEIKDRKHIQDSVDTLVSKLGMKKKGETVFEYFEDNDYNKERDIAGWSVVQIISLSNITIRIDAIRRIIHLDVFTCGELDDLIVRFLLSAFFKPTKMKNKSFIEMQENNR